LFGTALLGAILESHPAEGENPAFKGSMLITLAESVEEVKEIISKDIYYSSGVWDLEKAQIMPVSFLSMSWFSVPLALLRNMSISLIVVFFPLLASSSRLSARPYR
jgi:hypothetical protein